MGQCGIQKDQRLRKTDIHYSYKNERSLDCVCKDESQNNKGTGQGKKSGTFELSSFEKAEKKR